MSSRCYSAMCPGIRRLSNAQSIQSIPTKQIRKAIKWPTEHFRSISQHLIPQRKISFERWLHSEMVRKWHLIVLSRIYANFHKKHDAKWDTSRTIWSIAAIDRCAGTWFRLLCVRTTWRIPFTFQRLNKSWWKRQILYLNRQQFRHFCGVLVA